MPHPVEPKYLDITQAAQRVRRSRQSIENWIADGLEVVVVTVGGRKKRFVEEAKLLEMFRSKLLNNPSRSMSKR